MTKFKKVVAGVLAVAAMATSVAGLSASAAVGTLTVGNGYATLTNTSGTARYGNVSLQAVNRQTGVTVKSTSNGAVLSNHSSVAATLSGYSATTYRFVGSGTLYKGTTIQSGRYQNFTGKY